MKISKIYMVLLLGMILWGLFPIVTHRFVFSLDPVLLVSISTLTASIPFFILLFAKKEMGQFFSLKYLKTMLGVAFFTAAGQGVIVHRNKVNIRDEYRAASSGRADLFTYLGNGFFGRNS